MNKTVDIIIKVVLLGVIVTLAYLIVAGIQKPIDFEKERAFRFNVTIQRLKDIRTAQVAFRERYGYFTPSFDTLIHFINSDNIRVIKAIGTVPDTLTEKEALNLGIIQRDTFFVPIKDSLFKHINYKIENMRFSPVGKKVEFKMDTASVLTGSGVWVKVFQCYVLYDDILDGLDRQLIINYKSLKKDTCLRVGSLTEATNNAGNWE